MTAYCRSDTQPSEDKNCCMRSRDDDDDDDETGYVTKDDKVHAKYFWGISAFRLHTSISWHLL